MQQTESSETPDDSPVFLGILGEGCARPGRANLRLIRRAIREGWDIPEAKRKALVDHLMGVMEVAKPRDVMAAIFCVVEAEGINQREQHRAEKLAARQRKRHTR